MGQPKGSKGQPEGSEGQPEGSEGQLEGSEGQLEGSEGLLEGSKGLAEWSEGLPEGSKGLFNGSEARPQGILTGLPSLSAFSHVRCSQESIHRIKGVIFWVQSPKSINFYLSHSVKTRG